jgi:glycosyltransferase involved in cell wall biosynthesis
MKVNLIYNRIPHHAGRSGYDQLARYLARRVSVETVEGYEPTGLIGRTWAWGARRSGMEWYEEWSVGLEAAAALRLLRRSPEVFHVLYGENSYRYLGALRLLAPRRGHRIVCTYHQPPGIFEQVVRRRAILQRLDGIIAVASSQADYFASLVGKERVFVVPHGVDSDHFRPGERRAPDRPRCLSVGQWLRDFGMLRAVAERVATKDPGVRFTLITSEGNADCFEGLDNAEATWGVPDADLLQAYRDAGMLLLPLTDCTANNALLEGLACGLPIVTTDVGGIRDYVDAACAFVVPPGDVDAMCEAVLRLSADAELRMRMGRESRQRALRFDWVRVADEVAAVYRAVTP